MAKKKVATGTPAEQMAAAKNNTKSVWGTRRASRRPVVFPNNTVRTLRESLGLTQRDVSAGSGTNNATVADAEAGFEVSLTTAFKLARFFGKPVEELWPAESDKS